jgi:probable rRNA maturation factor
MPKGHFVVELDQTEDWGSKTDWEHIAQAAVDAAFAVADFAPEVRLSISINLSDNDEVQALNAQWRGKDKPTNVLSFPMLEGVELAALAKSPLPFKGEGWERGSHLRDHPLSAATSEQVRKSHSSPLKERGEILLGDLILAHTVCATEAKEKQIPLTQHVTHLIIHGTLHLLGLDHIDDAEAEHMEALEVKALASLGLPNPYSDH